MTTPKVGQTYKVDGQPARLIRIFPFNPRLPDRYRVQFANGHAVDVRLNELEPASKAMAATGAA